jgi:hypothetical protein
MEFHHLPVGATCFYFFTTRTGVLTYGYFSLDDGTLDYIEAVASGVTGLSLTWLVNQPEGEIKALELPHTY